MDEVQNTNALETDVRDKSIITLNNICKSYRVGDMELQILKNINLDVKEGEFVAIMGPSGSGKSTLMNIIGCLDRPTCGTLFVEGRDISKMSDDELARVRGMVIGFVFQSYNLVPRLTALENVKLPTYANSKGDVDFDKRARDLLKMVRLEERMHYKPNKLSGGQSQRVAVARAMINDPSLILADEPTGNLDSKTSDEIMKIFTDLNNKGRTIVMITHEPDVSEYAGRVVHLKDGIIEG